MADEPDRLFEIPLFPLNVVLFPGMALPLHVFESRYRQMVVDCLADHAPFGIVLALPESVHEREAPARVGTLAHIADYERLPDGRYNLLARGSRRFEIIRVHSQRPYPAGYVRPLRDEQYDETAMNLRALVREAQEALAAYLRLVLEVVGSDPIPIDIPDDPAELSYVIGMCLTCEDHDKQALLEMTSSLQRLHAGIGMLRAETQALEQQSESVTPHTRNTDRAHLN